MRGIQPEISVIMSIYNQENRTHLDAAILSVLRQTFTDFEFIIYNDGSSESIIEYLQKFADRDSRILLINNPVNHGLAYSLNACMDVARGKYIARMDDDDICDPERFRLQYEYMEAHPEVAFTGCNARLIDDTGIWGSRQMPEHPKKQDFLRFSPFIHPTVFIRREVLSAAEGYCSSKDTWRCEDYELFMRLQRLGYLGHNLQEELFSYREDRESYAKRRLCYRLDEMRLRYRNFRELKILFPFGWIYVIRPLLAALVPPGMLMLLKRFRHRWDGNAAPVVNAGRERPEVRAGIKVEETI